jgi:hypothetical protein
VPLVQVLSTLGSIRANVVGHLHTDSEGFNRPLELLKKEFTRSSVGGNGLLTVNSDEGEADTLNKDFMDFGVDAVYPELKSIKLW